MQAAEKTAILRIQSLALQVSLGVYAHEKKAPREIFVTLEAEIPASLANPRHDRLDEVVNYEALTDAALQVAAQGHIHLLETFCQRLAEKCLAIPEVLAIRISVEKHDAIADCQSTGVEIFRRKSDE